MINLLPKLKKAFPFLNDRSATEDDFFEFCARKNIEVVFSSHISTGLFVLYDGGNYIFLNNRLHGRFLRYVMFHELAHFLFHWPSQSNHGPEFFDLHTKQKNHIEAETAAALLLLPISELQNIEFADERLAPLITTRIDVYRRYKI